MPTDKLTDFPSPLNHAAEACAGEAHIGDPPQTESSTLFDKVEKVCVASVPESKDSRMESTSPLDNKGTLFFITIGGFFIANAIIAEFIGAKVFSLDQAFGLEPLYFDFAGKRIALFNLTAGALLWPLEFAISDTINEYFGRRGVKILTYLTIAFISYAFLIVFSAIQLPPAKIWLIQTTNSGGQINMEDAFQAIFGQGLWIIVGSLTAFLLGQFIDVSIFHKVKQYTGEKHLWLRTAGSTVVSQLVDSYVVLFISFSLNPQTNWDIKIILVMGCVKYSYKFFMVIALTPMIYLLHKIVDNYLGESRAHEMKERAMQY